MLKNILKQNFILKVLAVVFLCFVCAAAFNADYSFGQTDACSPVNSVRCNEKLPQWIQVCSDCDIDSGNEWCNTTDCSVTGQSCENGVCGALCTNGATQSCGSDIGECVRGTQTCAGGVWGTCAGEVGPTSEVCDGLDNNCDGTVDEICDCINGATQSCGSDIGECVRGTQTCSGGSWGVCVGEIGPTAEVCENGLDEDCNGSDLSCPPCEFTSAFWNYQTVDNGTLVSLNVGGQNCNGEEVSFLVAEEDLFSGDDSPVVQPANATFNGNSVSTTWIAEYQPDGFLGLNDPPEFYFVATLISDNNINITSADPLLEVNDAAPPTYQCNDGIDNDGDTLTDYPNDPGCASGSDNDETNVVGAGCDSTDPDLVICDDFEYVVDRNDPNNWANFQTEGGWTSVKTMQNAFGVNSRGYLYTSQLIPGFSGAFPGDNSNRVLVIESLPATFGAQTSHYLALGNGENPSYDDTIPGDAWIQFWIYPNHYGSQLSQFMARNKFLYPCNGPYPCNTNKWMIQIGASTYYPFSTEPYGDPTDGEAFLIQRDNTVGSVFNSNAPVGDESKLGQQDISEYITPNRWTLVKLHFDTSTTAGTWEAWLMPQGGGWTKVAEWISGVTPGFSWTIPASEVGGHRVLSMPTTFPGPNNNDFYDSWIYIDDFAIAASENALPVY